MKVTFVQKNLITALVRCKEKISKPVVVKISGTHTRTTGTIGDLYLTAANDILGAGLATVPTAARKLPGLVGQTASPASV